MTTGRITIVTLVGFLVACSDSNPVRTNSKRSAADEEFAVQYMLKFGYLPPSNPLLGEIRTKSQLENAIRGMQRFAGLKVTGKIDSETIKLMKKPRCGMPDFGPSDNMRRKKRYALHGTIWRKKDLTYRINNGPRTNKVNEKQVDQIIRLAFKKWSEVSQLTFKQIYEGTADIMISFETGSHDDGYPFDGAGGTLAHGFFPLFNTGLAGDVHFDDDENWVLGTKEGTDFFWTAIHEIGHSIGLDHSFYRSAIMFPFYQGYKANLELGEDDILGLQAIYGKPKTTLPPTTELLVTPAPTEKDAGPSPCHTSVDAAFHSRDGNTFFFKGEYFWKLDNQKKLSKALKLQDYWPQLRSRVQAAYTRPDGMTVFFKGRRFWVYNGTQYIEGPKIITEYGLPLDMKRLDAAFVWGGNRKTYFFKGHKYWRYNEVARSIDPGYPRNISDSWGAVPQPIDTVMTWGDGDSYFFKGTAFQKYEFYNQHQRMVGENIAEKFMGCSEVEVSARKPENAATRTLITTFVLFLLTLAVTVATL